MGKEEYLDLLFHAGETGLVRSQNDSGSSLLLLYSGNFFEGIVPFYVLIEKDTFLPVVFHGFIHGRGHVHILVDGAGLELNAQDLLVRVICKGLDDGGWHRRSFVC